MASPRSGCIVAMHEMNTESARDGSLPFLFALLLTLVGGLLAINLLPEWRANHVYVPTRCVVSDKRVVEHAGRRGVSYRPEFLIRHSVAGRDYEVWAYDA